MSELAPVNHEHQEALPSAEHLALPTAEQAEPLRAGEQDPTKQLEQARSDVEATVGNDNPIEKLHASEAAISSAPSPSHVNRELKNITLGRELKQIQRKLKAPDRALSKVIHQKAVRAVSEASGKTVARPSGLLGGGLLAFIGTTSYLFFSRHIGVEYNYLIFLLLFVGGFAIGLALELGVWVFTRHRSTE